MSSDFSGAEVYAQHCARCHTNAVGGAPRPGNSQDWLGRVAIGRADLLLSVLKGKGGMPPKGGNASLSIGEANAALDFMVAPIKR
ncbi:MAG: c-type cytochrome [Actinomycetota bacterium]